MYTAFGPLLVYVEQAPDLAPRIHKRAGHLVCTLGYRH